MILEKCEWCGDIELKEYNNCDDYDVSVLNGKICLKCDTFHYEEDNKINVIYSVDKGVDTFNNAIKYVKQ